MDASMVEAFPAAPRRIPARWAALFLLPLLVAGCAQAPGTAEGGSLYGMLEPDNSAVPPLGVTVEGAALVGAGAPPGAYVRRGTGIVGGQLLPGTYEVVPGAAGEINLSFADVPIAEVVRVILGDLLGRAFVIDPDVVGTVTLETPRPVPRDALLPILDAALATQGAGLIDRPEGISVVPIDDARGVFAPVGASSAGVMALQLRHAGAEDVARTIAGLVGEEVQVSVDAGRGLLIAAGDRRQLQGMAELVATLDVDVLDGMSFGLFPLRNADSGAVAAELEIIFAESGGARFIPIERQNAVLVITPRPEYLDRAEEWVRQLDRSGGPGDIDVCVYQVQYSRAVELAAVLAQVFAGAGPGADAPADEAGIAPGLTLATLTDEGAATSDAGTPFDVEGDLEDPFAAGLGTLPAGGGEAGIAPQIIADPSSNTVIVRATADDWRSIEAALRRLDQVPLQVLIEATIAEVTLNDNLRYGLQFAISGSDGSIGFTNGTSPVPVPTFPGFSYILTSGDVRVVLDALSQITDLQVISSPQLLVVNNQTAALQIGDQVPVATQSSVPVDSGDGRIVNTIEFRDTGVILRVTPRINPSGLIGIDVEQEVSDVVATTTSTIDSPTIRQRRVSSAVAVQSGETIVLGGLTRETTSRSRSGIPGLVDLPIVGPIFGSTTDNVGRSELLVLITPRIVRNSIEARAVTNELRQRLRAVLPPPATDLAPPPSPGPGAGEEPPPPPTPLIEDP
jgi:general secretion pathway protein D